GALIGAPLPLPGAYLPAPLIAVGDDTVVVFGMGGGTIDRDSRLEVGRVSQSGAVVTPRFAVVSDPEALFGPLLARRGPDVVLAWVGGANGYPGRIGLARLAP